MRARIHILLGVDLVRRCQLLGISFSKTAREALEMECHRIEKRRNMGGFAAASELEREELNDEEIDN